jgi:hypothetical protein
MAIMTRDAGRSRSAVLPGPSDVLQQQLGGTQALGLDVQKIANSISRSGTTAIVISLLYQGGWRSSFVAGGPT